MPRASRPCPTPGCPTLTTGGPCAACKTARELARGNSTQRGYARNPEHRTFRAAVLTKHPRCVICNNAPSIIADHWPRTRRELQATGDNVNDPRHGRGLCRTCDGRQGAARTPGGWNTH